MSNFNATAGRLSSELDALMYIYNLSVNMTRNIDATITWGATNICSELYIYIANSVIKILVNPNSYTFYFYDIKRRRDAPANEFQQFDVNPLLYATAKLTDTKAISHILEQFIKLTIGDTIAFHYPDYEDDQDSGDE